MKRLIMNIFMLLLIISISACSDVKKPSKSNFKNVLITSYSDGHYLIGSATFPISVKMDSHYYKGYQILAEAKILDYRGDPAQKFYKDGFFITYADIFNLTETGKKFYIQGRGLKLYDLKDIEVLSYSEPADENGYRVSNVKYKARFIPSDLLKFVDKNAKEQVLEKDVKMYLLDTGWKIME